MARKSYSEKLLDPRWQQMRLQVYERDKFACRCCGSTTKTLHAHHVHYHPYSDGPWDYDMDTIITLCYECHSDEHVELDAAKSNVLLQLAKIGFCTVYDMDVLCDILARINKNDLNKLFLEKLDGADQNNQA